MFDYTKSSHVRFIEDESGILLSKYLSQITNIQYFKRQIVKCKQTIQSGNDEFLGYQIHEISQLDLL